MICSQCNKEFNPSRQRRKYCSQECVSVARKEQIKKNQQTDSYIAYKKKLSQTDKSKAVAKEYRQSDKYKAAAKEYKHLNKEKLKEYQKKYKQSDKGKAAYAMAHEKYRQSANGKENIKKYTLTDKFKEYARIYKTTDRGKAANKKVYEKRKSKGLINEWARKYDKEKRRTDPIYKLKGNIRRRLIIFLKVSKMRKTNSTFKMVGCTPEFLKDYLEKQFSPGMTWQNHTKDGWHIDHIIPLSAAKTEKDIEKLMNYTNLQPMWATENIKKSNKIL